MVEGGDVWPSWQTGADSSDQNGPAEHGHLTVANAIRAMLIGGNLDIKFHPWASHHWIRIDNSIPSRDQKETPLKIVTGNADDFSSFRAFGCRACVRPPGGADLPHLPAEVVTKHFFTQNTHKHLHLHGQSCGFVPTNVHVHTCLAETVGF